MARNFSDMVDDAIRKKIASFKVGYGDEWVKEFLEWAGQDVEPHPAPPTASERLQEYLSQADETAEWYRRFERKANMSLFEIVFGEQPQPAQPARRLVKRWLIFAVWRTGELWDIDGHVVHWDVPVTYRNGPVERRFAEGYSTEEEAQQALFQDDGLLLNRGYVIVPVYRVEVTTGDGCPKCGGAPSRYYFGCDTPGCENYNDGSRVDPVLKAKIDASINYD